MNNKQKFENFLESLKGKDHDTLIESVKTGFQACYEGNIQPQGHYITTSYEMIDEESAEMGDTADSGWEDEEGQSMEPDEFDMEEGKSVIDLTVEFLNDKGAWENSGDGTSWRTTDPSGTRDYYEKGESTYYTCHLNNYTSEELDEVQKRMGE